jgi:hypothetical protein
MRISASCLTILTLCCPANASDVQQGDSVIAKRDGVACSDLPSFEAFRDSDPKTPNKLPGTCLIVHADTMLIADDVNQSAGIACVRVDDKVSRLCFWLSLDKLVARLPAGQRRL